MFDRKEYYKRTKHQQIDTVRRWRKNNPEKYKEQTAAHYKRSKETCYVQLLLRSAKQRAKKQAIPFNLTIADVDIPSHCPVLGIPLLAAETLHNDNSPSLDRIVPNVGYVPGNVVVVSWRANRLKSDATLLEIQQMAQYYLHR